MADAAHHDRTEAPTARRREQAQKEGQVAHSSDLTAAVVLLTLALWMRWCGPSTGAELLEGLQQSLPTLAHADLGLAEVSVFGRWFAARLLWVTGGACVAAAVAGLLAEGLQVGWRVHLPAVSVNWSRVSPSAGWQRLCSADGLMRGLGVTCKALVVACTSVMLLSQRWHVLRAGTTGTLRQTVTIGWEAISSTLLAVATVMLLWAVADYLYRWVRNEQRLRMTRQELADELKQDEGHPQLKARLRQLQRQAAARKSLRAVPAATIVLTNPTHIAVALQYRLGQPDAPRVVAKGKGALAQRIVRLAREHGVPVQEARPVARALYKYVPVGREIPGSLFQVVAEILARLYQRQRGV